MTQNRLRIFLGLLSGISVGSLVGAGGDTSFTARGTSYLSDDPAACVNC